MEIRKINAELAERVETGAIQFNEDWPGVFIRGDNAAYFAYALEAFMNGNEDPFTVGAVRNLMHILRSSQI